MLKPQTRLFLALVILSVTALSKAEEIDFPRSIIAITSNQKPIQLVDESRAGPVGVQLEITFLNLDTVQAIQNKLSDGLPIDPAQARTIVDQRIAQMGRSQLDAELRAAYLPLGTMMAYGLDRYPVIIFDQQAVIYGVTDLAQAIDQYRQWREDRQGVSVYE